MDCNRRALKVSIAQVNVFLILRTVFSRENGKMTTRIKIVHESLAGIRWRKLEFQIVCEVEFAVCVPSVLVSLVEGPNTRFVLVGTAVNTSVA
jgi:hypothetical protein